MREVIDGKIYDTDEAKKIESWKNMPDSGDFRYVKEVLYKTDNGNWFLHGRGGPKTEYRKSLGSQGATGSSKIKPFTEEQAYNWLEQHGDVETIEKHFADRIEPA